MTARWSIGDTRRNKYLTLGVAIVLAALVLSLLRGAPAITNGPGAGAPKATAPDLARLPLLFEPNAGQTDPSVLYMAHAPGGALYFTSGEVVLSLITDDGPEGLNAKQNHAKQNQQKAEGSLENPQHSALSTQSSVVRLQFVGANAAPAMQSSAEMPGKVSYMLGNDPAQWHTSLPTYSGVTYTGLYPGVDLHYEGTNGQLKGTYTLAPGADPSRIQWQYAGTSNATVDASGNLQLGVQGSKVTLTEQAPVAWQMIDGLKCWATQ